MRLATYVHDGRERVGAVEGEAIVDLGERFDGMLDLIRGGPAALEAARELCAGGGSRIPLDAVRLRAPLPRPVQIRDFLVFESHLRGIYDELEAVTGTRREIPPVWYEQPIYYKCNRLNVVGPDAEVRWPHFSEHLDFELELACVIGRAGVDVPEADAGEHIFGYTIFNDFTARDAQFREAAGGLGPAKGKDFDTANVLGPWIVTRDELPDIRGLAMEARVNGERWGGGSAGAMHHSFERMIEHLSQAETIHPGEVLGSGTVGGGCGFELGRRLHAGDRVELEVDGIGTLANRVVRGAG